MWHSVKVFLFLPPLLLALDYVWLGIFASDLYKKELGPFLRMFAYGGYEGAHRRYSSVPR